MRSTLDIYPFCVVFNACHRRNTKGQELGTRNHIIDSGFHCPPTSKSLLLSDLGVHNSQSTAIVALRSLVLGHKVQGMTKFPFRSTVAISPSPTYKSPTSSSHPCTYSFIAISHTAHRNSVKPPPYPTQAMCPTTCRIVQYSCGETELVRADEYDLDLNAGYQQAQCARRCAGLTYCPETALTPHDERSGCTLFAEGTCRLGCTIVWGREKCIVGRPTRSQSATKAHNCRGISPPQTRHRR